MIDNARTKGQDALGICNDPELAEAIEELGRRRQERQMKKLTALLTGFVNSYREFSFKLGRKDGLFVVELGVPPFKPAAAMGMDLVHVLETASGKLRRSIDPHAVIVALDEQDLDNAVTELEDAASDDDGTETSFHG
jgi:hypothetical protein